jgi:hypothetical protein
MNWTKKFKQKERFLNADALQAERLRKLLIEILLRSIVTTAIVKPIFRKYPSEDGQRLPPCPVNQDIVWGKVFWLVRFPPC